MDRSLFTDPPQQMKEIGFGLQIQAIPTQMNAGEYDFVVSGIVNRVHMLQDGFKGHASAGASGMGHNAIRAIRIASVLNFKKGSRSAAQSRKAHILEQEDVLYAVPNVLQRCSLCIFQRFRKLRNTEFVGMAHDGVHTLDFFNFIWFGLSQTAGDDDGRLRIRANGLANGLAGLHGCFTCHGAGVDDAQARFFGGERLFGIQAAMACCDHFMGDGFGFILVDFASQGDDAKDAPVSTGVGAGFFF